MSKPSGGENLPDWSPEVEAQLKDALSHYMQALQARLKPKGVGTGQGMADEIGGGLVQSAVSNWLNGKTFASVPNLHAIALYVGLTPGELLDLLYAESGLPFKKKGRRKGRFDGMSKLQIFAQICRESSGEEMLNLQKIWLNECLERRDL